MSQAIAKILVHVVFSTKDRRPFLRDDAIRQEMHVYLAGILSHRDCLPVIVGGVADHVRLLVSLSRTGAPAETIKEIKRSSTLWLKNRQADFQDFAWQNGYGMFSLGFSPIEQVKKYIAGQEAHHQKTPYREEFLALLRRYQIPYNENYLWD